jgi:hypothetical protein
MVLATSIPAGLAEELSGRGVEVHAFQQTRRIALGDLAEAALELRTRHPRLPLYVLGPARLLRRFEARYPPLSDGLIDDQTARSLLL